MGTIRATARQTRGPARASQADRGLSSEVRKFLESAFHAFPWRVTVSDWTEHEYVLGLGGTNWCGKDLEVEIKTPGAARTLLRLNALGFIEHFLRGDVDLRGNLYFLTDLEYHADFRVSAWRAIPRLLADRTFQKISRARVNVKSHYDIPQEALNTYLDQAYLSYSCGMFENPGKLDVREAIRVGRGRSDRFDSLEKSMWRKFQDAVDFIDAADGETMLDIGCGYGGQLAVSLESRPATRVVGWTHSANQVREGRRLLREFDPQLWELHEGDYREETRVFDHVTSTGMISHVGPRGLVPYVRNIRARIRKGGRYLHHALMVPHQSFPIDLSVGIAFNKRYVWPGFHWFRLGDHVKALEENGFEVVRLQSLAPHYAKTTFCWYERMMQNEETMRRALGESSFRAWQVYLAGAVGGFLNGGIHVYRVYCRAK